MVGHCAVRLVARFSLSRKIPVEIGSPIPFRRRLYRYREHICPRYWLHRFPGRLLSVFSHGRLLGERSGCHSRGRAALGCVDFVFGKPGTAVRRCASPSAILCTLHLAAVHNDGRFWPPALCSARLRFRPFLCSVGFSPDHSAVQVFCQRGALSCSQPRKPWSFASSRKIRKPSTAVSRFRPEGRWGPKWAGGVRRICSG